MPNYSEQLKALFDSAKQHVSTIPHAALGAGAGAVGGGLLGALFPSRDEKGNSHRLRNSLLGAVGGGALGAAGTAGYDYLNKIKAVVPKPTTETPAELPAKAPNTQLNSESKLPAAQKDYAKDWSNQLDKVPKPPKKGMGDLRMRDMEGDPDEEVPGRPVSNTPKPQAEQERIRTNRAANVTATRNQAIGNRRAGLPAFLDEDEGPMGPQATGDQTAIAAADPSISQQQRLANALAAKAKLIESAKSNQSEYTRKRLEALNGPSSYDDNYVGPRPN